MTRGFYNHENHERHEIEGRVEEIAASFARWAGLHRSVCSKLAFLCYRPIPSSSAAPKRFLR
ncbi:MAG: hypothetical protein ACYTER_11830, partial [Planctomycetota bacterium]